MAYRRLRIGLKLLAIIDVLFAEKWELQTYKNSTKQALTRYDSKEFKNKKNTAPCPKSSTPEAPNLNS